MKRNDMYNLWVAYNEDREQRIQQQKNAVIAENAEMEQLADNLRNMRESAHQKQLAFSKFSQDVKKSLLCEAIMVIYNKSLGIQLEYFNTDALKVSLVNKFIEENGADNLLYGFQGKSLLLSEINRIVNKYHKIIIEKVDRNNPDSLMIDPEDKQDFFDDLDMESMDDVASEIKMRVANDVEVFIQNNINDKIEIKDILSNVQDKINSAMMEPEDIKESYELISKRRISDIRNNRPRNIFEQMVRNISESVVKDDQLKKLYSENGKLNMDKIVESCNLMYTLLEMANTTKMIKIDEEYISNLLESLRL